MVVSAVGVWIVSGCGAEPDFVVGILDGAYDPEFDADDRLLVRMEQDDGGFDAVRVDLETGAQETVATDIWGIRRLGSSGAYLVEAGGVLLRLEADGTASVAWSDAELAGRPFGSDDTSVLAYSIGGYNDVRFVKDGTRVEVMEGSSSPLDGNVVAMSPSGSRFAVRDVAQLSTYWQIDVATGQVALDFERPARATVFAARANAADDAIEYGVITSDGYEVWAGGSVVYHALITGDVHNAAGLVPGADQILALENDDCGRCDPQDSVLVAYSSGSEVGERLAVGSFPSIAVQEAVAAPSGRRLAVATDGQVFVVSAP